MRTHTARTQTCRTLRLAAIVLTCMLPAAHAEWNAGAFTNAATYTATGNWVGGVIDDIIGPGTTISAGAPNDDARFTWAFAADHATGSGGITFDYTVGLNSPNLILAASGASRTLTMNGDFYWDQGGAEESGIIGQWGANALNIDLGGGNREFIMTGMGNPDNGGMRFYQNISNGGLIFDHDSKTTRGDTGGDSNAGVIILNSTDYTGTTDIRSGLMRLRDTPSWVVPASSGAITGSSLIKVGNTSKKLRLQGYGSPAKFEVGDNVSGNLNRIGDSATLELDSGWVRFRHGNAAAAGGIETLGRIDVLGLSQIDVENNHASQSYTVQASSLNRVNRGVSLIALTSPGGGARALKFDSAPTTVGGGGSAGDTGISIVPYLYSVNSMVTYDANGLRTLDTSTELLNATDGAGLMAAADDDNVRLSSSTGNHVTFTLSGDKTVNSLIILGPANAGNTLTLTGGHTLTVTSGSVLFGGNVYYDVISVGTLDFGSAEGVITVQNVRADQRKLITSVITGSGGVTFSSGNVNSTSNGRFIIGGANNYTGPTTFTKGLFYLNAANRIPDTSVVHVGSAASVYFNGNDTIAGLTGSGHINGSTTAILTIDNTGTNDFSGEIAGTITLAKAGSGTQILSGTNTYTGATIINAGTLEIGGSGVLGSGSHAGAITNNAIFAYAGSATQTLSGIVSGAGALHVGGSGTLTLTGTNTYTGATVVQAGVLELTRTNALASATALDIRAGGEVRLSFTGTSVIRSLTVNGVTKPRGIYTAGSLPGLTGTAGAFVETLEPPPTGTLIAIR